MGVIWGKILCSSSICAACWFACMVCATAHLRPSRYIILWDPERSINPWTPTVTPTRTHRSRPLHFVILPLVTVNELHLNEPGDQDYGGESEYHQGQFPAVHQPDDQTHDDCSQWLQDVSDARSGSLETIVRKSVNRLSVNSQFISVYSVYLHSNLFPIRRRGFLQTYSAERRTAWKQRSAAQTTPENRARAALSL